MLSPRPGQSFATLHRVSGVARFQPDGETGWLDLGDVEMHRPTAEVSRKVITRAARFGTEVRAEEITAAQFAWSLNLQEYIAATLEAQFFATPQLDADLPALDAQVVSFPNVSRNRIYHIGAFDIRNVIVAVGTEVFTEDVDYTVTGITGDALILEHGTIPPGSTITVAFDAPAARYNVQTNASARTRKLTRRGTLRLMEFDGGETPLSIITFTCSLCAEEWGERSVTDRSVFTLRALQLGPADYRTRALPEPTSLTPNRILRWGNPLRRLGVLRCDSGSVLILR